MASDPFAPPPEDEKPLEIEKDWGQEKAKKQATAVVADTPKPAPKRSNTWLWLVLGVVVAGVVAAGVIVQMSSRHKDVHSTLPPTENTVSIEIRSKGPAQIKIDGNKAGKTPLTLHVRKGTTPIQIDNGKQIKSVIPDRDQLVDFTR